VSQLKENKIATIDLVVGCMGKKTTWITNRFSQYNPVMFTKHDLLKLDSAAGTDFADVFDVNIQIFGDFKVSDYQAYSKISIGLLKNKAVECIVSLGEPAKGKYLSESDVFRYILMAMEEKYQSGRKQQDNKHGRVYTWQKDNTLISFASLQTPDGSQLNIQIRDSQLHPIGEEFTSWYKESKTLVSDELTHSPHKLVSWFRYIFKGK
jgi:hypothetical protein